MLYFKNRQLQSLNYLDCGICGRFEFSSSSFSNTDCVSRISSLDIATIAILHIINNVAIIEVNLVKKVPTDLKASVKSALTAKNRLLALLTEINKNGSIPKTLP